MLVLKSLLAAAILTPGIIAWMMLPGFGGPDIDVSSMSPADKLQYSGYLAGMFFSFMAAAMTLGSIVFNDRLLAGMAVTTGLVAGVFMALPAVEAHVKQQVEAYVMPATTLPMADGQMCTIPEI